jgi:HEAT repeat protein
LLEPAAELAKKDTAARSFVARTLTSDPNRYLRLGAARAITDPKLFAAELQTGLRDREVRVREAVVDTLGQTRSDFAAAGLVERLQEDKWPLVRSRAAEAMARLGRDPNLDAALAEALEPDESPAVRAPAIQSLGARGATQHLEVIREHFEDDEEAAQVRREAARTLGILCDYESLDSLTDYALKLENPMLEPDKRSVAFAALRALGRLGSADLAERLEPILDPRRAPVAAVQAAREALASTPACRRTS